MYVFGLRIAFKYNPLMGLLGRAFHQVFLFNYFSTKIQAS